MKILRKSSRMKALSYLLFFMVSCTTIEPPKNTPRYSKISKSTGAKVTQSLVKTSTRIDKKYEAFKGEVVYKELKVESDWIGGTEENPIYFTSSGERIYSLGKDIYIYPVTVLSMDEKGNVVYPEDGIKLIGDMQVEHFLALVKALGEIAEIKNICFIADSNYLERPAKVIDLNTDKEIAKFKFGTGKWEKLK